MKKIKQILAIICVTVLLGLYVATFVLSLMDSPKAVSMFKGCVACTIFIPIAAYAFICLHRYAMFRSKRSDGYSSYDDKTESDGK